MKGVRKSIHSRREFHISLNGTHQRARAFDLYKGFLGKYANTVLR